MQFSGTIRIDNFIVEVETPTFIIAEAGVNHNGDMHAAKKMIDCALEAKVDAVKFQSFKAEHLILKKVEKASYQLKTTNKGESQFDMLKKLEVKKSDMQELQAYCKSKGIIFLVTAFDEWSLDELDELNLPAYKVASTDITNLPFLKKIALKNKPIILSTGMAYLHEIEKALSLIAPINDQVILLQCSANYPLDTDEVNLNVIKMYKEKFDMLVGFSDHTPGIGASPYAVAMGAKVIEKHFTLDKNQSGPDHKASLDPAELKAFVKEIRTVEQYMGSPMKIPVSSEQDTRKSLQKCLVAAKPIEKGEMIGIDKIIAKRTGGVGISPIDYEKIVGMKADKDYQPDEILEV